MSLVTIKKDHLEGNLSVLKSKLESEGISCFMRNEFTTQIMNHLPSFEVELQVDQSDLQRALEIMKDFDS